MFADDKVTCRMSKHLKAWFFKFFKKVNSMTSMESTVAIKPEAAVVCTKSLESIFTRSNPEEMCEALQTAIQLASNGQNIDHLVLPVIKHASTSTDHRLKKLLHIFWPLVECYHGGQLKSHIILMSNSILHDLNSPNEMILCSALRCILHLQVIEVISNLITGIPPLLSHPDCRVRCAAVSAIHSVRARYGDIISLGDIYTRLTEEENVAVLRRLIFLLADLEPENGALHVLKLIKRVGASNVSDFLYDVLPQLVKGMQGDKIGFLDAVLSMTKKSIAQFNSRVQYSAGLGLWAVVVLYPTISFQSMNKDQTTDTHNRISREDIAVMAVQCLLHASRTIDDNCMITLLDIIKEAVSLFSQAFMNHNIVSSVIFSLCSSHMSDATRSRLLELKLFSTLAKMGPARQLLEAFILSPFISTNCLTVLYESVSEVFIIVSSIRASEELMELGSNASILTELVHKVTVYSQTYITLTKTNSGYKCGIWTDICCDVVKVLLCILRGLVVSDSSPSTVAMETGQLCIKLLLHLILCNKGPDGRWNPEVSRAAIVAIGDVSPILVLLLTCYFLKITLKTSIEDEESSYNFSTQYLGISPLSLLPTAIAEASKNFVDSRTLCGLATKEIYDSQDSLIIAVCCRYLIRGIDACIEVGLYSKENISGILLVGIAKYYKLIEKSTSICNSDLCFINSQLKYILEYSKGGDSNNTSSKDEVEPRKELHHTEYLAGLSSTSNKLTSALSNPISSVQFNILGTSTERPAVTPETTILTRGSGSDDLYNILVELAAPQLPSEIGSSFTTIFTRDTDFSLYVVSHNTSSQAISGDSAGKLYSSGSLGNVVQLSGDSERIYAEAVVQVSPSLITLEVLFINRINESAQDVTLELFASPSLRVPRSTNRVVNLEPYGSARDKYTLYVDNCEAGVIYGNIIAKFTQNKQKNEPRTHEVIHRTKEIDINIRSFLAPCILHDREFCRMWAIFDWEYKVVVLTSAPPEGVALMVKSSINAYMIPEEESLLMGDLSDTSTGEKKLRTYCCNFSTQSRGTIVLLNLSLEVFCNNEGSLTSGCLKLRSPSKALAQSISSYLSSTLVL